MRDTVYNLPIIRRRAGAFAHFTPIARENLLLLTGRLVGPPCARASYSGSRRTAGIAGQQFERFMAVSGKRVR